MTIINKITVEKVSISGNYVKEITAKDGKEYIIVRLPYKAITSNQDLSNYTFISDTINTEKEVFMSNGSVKTLYHVGIYPEATYKIQRRKLKDGAVKMLTDDGKWLNTADDFEVLTSTAKGSALIDAIKSANENYLEYKRAQNEKAE